MNFDELLNEEMDVLLVESETYSPPKAVQNAAKQGLELRKKAKGGTSVGVARARDLSNGKNVSYSTIKRMHSYFQRHSVDKNAKGWNQGDEGYPSKGKVAHLLWGGDAGKRWAASIVNKANESLEESTINEETVEWNWQGKVTSGKVKKKYKSPVTRDINGSKITKNGSDNNPAFLIVQNDGSEVLKLKSELKNR